MLYETGMTTLEKMIAMHPKATERQHLCCLIRKEISDLLSSVKEICPKEADDLQDKISFLFAYRDNMMENLIADYDFRPEIEQFWSQYEKNPSQCRFQVSQP